jgi:PIN domain nuclease of toxin-antitoxin system
MNPLLLDTHVVLAITENEAISEAAVHALDEAEDVGVPAFVSPITAWEIGLLVARGKIALPTSPRAWFERVLEAPNTRLAEMPPEVLISSSFLPNAPVKDPADRILVATAREYGFTLVTKDRALLGYAAAGHLKAIQC